MTDGALHRILLVANSAFVGGGNRVILELSSELQRRGFTPTVVSPEAGALVEACRDRRIDCEVVASIQPTWSAPRSAWQNLKTWRELIRDLDVDVVHANGSFSARSVSHAARLSQRPLVCHVHFPVDDCRWLYRGIPKPDVFVFCSQSVQRECGEQLRVACPRSRQIVVHNAVQASQWHGDVAAACHEPVRIGIVANLLPVKGHLDFLTMSRLLTDQGVDGEYWIIGDDIFRTGYRQQLEDFAAALGLAARVKFLGYRTDVPALVKDLDIVVCASHEEPFGLCVAEAMASARPVVATRVGGIPEIVVDGETGLLVSPDNPDELARAVARILGDDRLRRRFALAGRTRIETCFSHRTYAENITKVYASLGAGHRRNAA
jgi:glycosyltransferase involved in cell wall biosynthesis